MTSKLTTILALSTTLVLGSAAPLFAQTSLAGTDCPANTSVGSIGTWDPAGKAKAPGAEGPCQPAAGSAGASGADASANHATVGGNYDSDVGRDYPNETGSITTGGPVGNGTDRF